MNSVISKKKKGCSKKQIIVDTSVKTVSVVRPCRVHKREIIGFVSYGNKGLCGHLIFLRVS